MSCRLDSFLSLLSQLVASLFQHRAPQGRALQLDRVKPVVSDPNLSLQGLRDGRESAVKLEIHTAPKMRRGARSTQETKNVSPCIIRAPREKSQQMEKRAVDTPWGCPGLNTEEEARARLLVLVLLCGTL